MKLLLQSLALIFLLSISFVLPAQIAPTQSHIHLLRFEHRFPIMGVEAKLIAYANSQTEFEVAKHKAVDKAKHLEAIFSNYSSESECEKLCATAPHSQPLRVTDELFEVLLESKLISKQTQQAFDPTIGATTAVWRMARKRNRLPDDDKINHAMKRSGWSHVKLNPEDKSVSIDSKGLRFDFGAIAKGYAADTLIKVFRKQGIDSALVDIGGDIVVSDRPPESEGWTIKLQSSLTDTHVLLLENCAVATSGDLKQHLTKNNTRYSHIIDPRTGKAIENACGVTVISPSGLLADAMASAISVLGPDKGTKAIKEFANTEARFECPQSNRVHQSQGFAKFISH